MTEQTAVNDLPTYTGEEWLDDHGYGSDADAIEYLGITPETTDTELREMASAENEAYAHWATILDLVPVLFRLRNACRDGADLRGQHALEG